MSAEPPRGSFLFDENLSPQLAEALQLLEEPPVEIFYITKFFPASTDDVVYLPVLGRCGAFLITRDTKQRRKPAELAAYRTNGVGAFILGGKNLLRWDLVKQVVLSWHHIKEAAVNTQRPFAYRVRPNGGKLEPLAL